MLCSVDDSFHLYCRNPTSAPRHSRKRVLRWRKPLSPSRYYIPVNLSSLTVLSALTEQIDIAWHLCQHTFRAVCLFFLFSIWYHFTTNYSISIYRLLLYLCSFFSSSKNWCRWCTSCLVALFFQWMNWERNRRGILTSFLWGTIKVAPTELIFPLPWGQDGGGEGGSFWDG